MQKKETLTLAGGCFWCTEAIFKRLKGVISVTSGYAGGQINNPSYENIITGKTGHTEAIQIEFDKNIITFKKLLEVFFKTHDPTTKDRQGADIGSQYRSVIFYANEVQRKASINTLKEVLKEFKTPVVTEIVPFKNFYKAEDYHQDFYEKNPGSMYCRLVIDPKIQKLYKEFKKDVKEEAQT